MDLAVSELPYVSHDPRSEWVGRYYLTRSQHKASDNQVLWPLSNLYNRLSFNWVESKKVYSPIMPEPESNPINPLLPLVLSRCFWSHVLAAVAVGSGIKESTNRDLFKKELYCNQPAI